MAIPTADAEFSGVEMLNPDNHGATEIERGEKRETLFSSCVEKGAVSTAVLKLRRA